ncbi:MAG TPA: lamin tail domain-containing protein [Lacipirellulaceae bacterium]|nr:lamin tail domain-containing protein [Lacipirellulaceae bacterium]
MLAATDLRITEFLASNDDGLQDVDGDSSDWIEIYNAGPTAVDMGGPPRRENAKKKRKWKFPAGSMIEAGGYRVIFASNKNGIRGNGELHTNFALSAGGEYLGLIAADGVTVIDQYAPQFPPQFEDVSYGRAMEISPTTTTLIATGAQARAWVPTSSVYDATWRNVNFNDAVFNIVGPTGLGYENNPGDAVNFTAEIATPVPANIRSLYMRISFDLTSLAGIDQLMLRMKFDDGFIAYINGQKVAERNAPEGAQWNSQATTTHPDNLAKQFINFDVSAALPALRVGQNVLAIHGLNQPTGSDMLISPELVASAATIVTPERIGYFENPTPGYGNGWNYLGFLDRPTFSVPHGFYSTVQSVAITSSEPGTVIVYTTNGSTPAVNQPDADQRHAVHRADHCQRHDDAAGHGVQGGVSGVVRHGQLVPVRQRHREPEPAGPDAAGLRPQRREWPGDELRDRSRHHRAVRPADGEGLATGDPVDFGDDRSGESVQRIDGHLRQRAERWPRLGTALDRRTDSSRRQRGVHRQRRAADSGRVQPQRLQPQARLPLLLP